MSDFSTANIDELVSQLTTDEAILLTAGEGSWGTCAIDRLGIPAVQYSDGPNGVRGDRLFMSLPAKCLPSGTGLGATWDPALIKEIGVRILAKEAKRRKASIIIAPTCNIPRSPLGGRTFESYSEDPFLCGIIAASFINGVQGEGIGATIKHFVANDKEDDRNTYDSVMSARAFREVYLMPFMLAQKLAQPWCFMTAYNRVNGIEASENDYLLKNVLRDEWKYKNLVMSDWFGTYGIIEAYKAGVDLEMPGANKWRTLNYVGRTIQSGKVPLATVKARAKNVLNLVQKCVVGNPSGASNDNSKETAVDSTEDSEGKVVDSEEDKEFMRKVARESIVLLRNERNTLPLVDKDKLKIAVIGPNAKATVLSGGGSAALKASYFITPYDGIANALKKAGNEFVPTYSEGVQPYKLMPVLDHDMLHDEDGQVKPGWIANWYTRGDTDSLDPFDKEKLEALDKQEPFFVQMVDESFMFILTTVPAGISRTWILRAKGYLTPKPYDRHFQFGLIVSGRGQLFVDGQEVIHNWEWQEPGSLFFGQGTKEMQGTFELKANTKPEITLVFCNVQGRSQNNQNEAVMDVLAGLRLGGAEIRVPAELLQEAVDIAKAADVVIAVVGLNADWEAEGYDRQNLALPKGANPSIDGKTYEAIGTDEFVEAIVKANRKTIVVNQGGSAVTMPWAYSHSHSHSPSVPAIVHAWYLGNATGDAIADVLFGYHNPSGKLPLTFPRNERQMPSYGHFRTENGKIRYAEDLYVGYKHYHLREITPLFAFGHGLSYTTFAFKNLRLSPVVVQDCELTLTVTLTVENTGDVAGSEVVQVYTALSEDSTLSHPLLQLKGFAKVRDLAAGASEDVQVVLDKYAVSYWNEVTNTWTVEKGVYRVEVGSSIQSLHLKGEFELKEGFEWNGL